MMVLSDEPMCCVISIMKNTGLRLDEALRVVIRLSGIKDPAIHDIG